jgi:hypothetical protein
MKREPGVLILFVIGATLLACEHDPPMFSGTRAADAAVSGSALHSESAPASHGPTVRSFPVSGTAVHFFSTAITHSQSPTETGMIQRSTDIVELTGDLHGYLLYHSTSSFDHVDGTLVNTGIQVFSGTIADSDPVVLHDDRFRFEVDLSTGHTEGRVHLARSKDAPAADGWFECDLHVLGTGLTAEGDALADYSGECTRRGAPD